MMATIRTLAEKDVPAVTALFERVYPEYRWPERAECESYFREILFGHPWGGLQLPSWVAEVDGRICGAYMALPRPMLWRGRPIRVAVGCQIMVDPNQRHSLIALQLAKALLSGPQDLTLADGSSREARRLWTGIGGTSPPLYSLHWTRPLRPARYALSLLEERAGFRRGLALAASPLCAAADAVAGRLPQNRFFRAATELTEDALDPVAMLARLPDALRGYSLQPVYDAHSLAWLLDQAARKTRHGTLRARAVRDGAQRLLGWYLYYLHPGGAGEVVQVAASDEAFDPVLGMLLADAWRHGAAAVRGRLDPRRVEELSGRHCWFRWDSTWTLVHSRDREIVAAIEQGDAFLSRLEGEWWLRFLGG